jgi:hypothetical protein
MARKRSDAAVVRAAAPILRRIAVGRGPDGFTGSIGLVFLALEASNVSYSAAQRVEIIRRLVAAATRLLHESATDVADLAALVGDPTAPAYRERHAPKAAAEALDWLRRQLDGLGKDGA